MPADDGSGRTPGGLVAWYGNNATSPSRLHRLADDTSRTRCGLTIPDGRVQHGPHVQLSDWEGSTCQRSCFPELQPTPEVPAPEVGQSWRKLASGRRGDYAGLVVWVQALGPEPGQVTLCVGVDGATGKIRTQAIDAGRLDGRRYEFLDPPPERQ